MTLDPNPRTILVHAHRGGRAFRPENSIPAFEYGIAAGADVMELDLAVTKDDVLVVCHSPYLTPPDAAAHAGERRCEGPPTPPGTLIRSLTFAQLRQYDCGFHTLAAFPLQQAVPHTPIPTLDEVLALAEGNRIEFNIETKIFPSHPEFTPTPETFVALIDDAIKRHRVESRIILQSFDFRTLHAMRALNPTVRRSALFGHDPCDRLMGIPDHGKSFAHIAQVSGADILSPDQSLVTPDEVKSAHDANLQVAPYTVNNVEGWQKMADAHVDAIITDDPTGLLAWLRVQHPPLHP